MNQLERMKAVITDLALIAGSMPRSALKSRQRQALTEAVTRATAELQGVDLVKPTPAEAERELAAALARCANAGVGWDKVRDLVNDWGDSHPAAHRSAS